MRIGLLGGSFDPPHSGHLALAKSALEELSLDEVVFVPAHRNPLKKEPAGAGSKQRLEMTRLAVTGEERMAVSDIEIARGGASYMYETLSELQYVREGEYWLILGADALKNFMQWKNPEKIVRMCRLAVARRGGQTHEDLLGRLLPEFHSRIDWLNMPLMEISATELRLRIGSGRPVEAWLKPKVIEYIVKNKLYRR